MDKPLTSKQKTIYTYIRNYLLEKDFSPTLEEIRSYVGVGAINTVIDHLKALENKGYIVRRKHAKRNIEIREVPNSENESMIMVPVVASVGCDDLSVYANETHDEFLRVDRKIASSGDKLVAVRAIGDSMNDADIMSGDYVLIRLTDHAENGDRVVAIVDDMVTVKKLEVRDNMIILWPESKDLKYKPIILNQDFKIAGKVVCTLPKETMDSSRVEPLPKESYEY